MLRFQAFVQILSLRTNKKLCFVPTIEIGEKFCIWVCFYYSKFPFRANKASQQTDFNCLKDYISLI